MGVENLDAKVRIELDTSSARREQEELSRDLERGEREEDRRKREKRRKEGKERLRRGGPAGRPGLGIGGRAAKLAGTLLVVSATLEAVELIAPAFAQFVEKKVEGIPGIEQLAKGARMLAEEASDGVSSIKAALSAGFATASGVGDAARAVGILGGKELSDDEAAQFARRLYRVTFALDRAERQQTKLVRERIVKTFGDLVDPTSFFK
jgi:hypothetical protein